MLRKTARFISLIWVLVRAGTVLAWTSVDVGTPAPGNATFDDVTSTWTVAGEYTFWVAGDDNTELFLGPDPESGEVIAEVPTWTGAQAWDTLPTQRSEPIFLEADRYYIAALWKEGGGGDHASAAWQGPGVPERTLIAGSFLKAFEAVWAFGPRPLAGAVDVTQTPTRWRTRTSAPWMSI